MKKILCVGLVVSFGVILSLGFSKKSYAKIDHNFSFSDGGNTGGGGGKAGWWKSTIYNGVA